MNKDTSGVNRLPGSYCSLCYVQRMFKLPSSWSFCLPQSWPGACQATLAGIYVSGYGRQLAACSASHLCVCASAGRWWPAVTSSDSGTERSQQGSCSSSPPPLDVRLSVNGGLQQPTGVMWYPLSSLGTRKFREAEILHLLLRLITEASEKVTSLSH